MNKLRIAITAFIASVILLGGTASAWTYGLSGNGACQPDGSYKISWKVDNSSEPQALNITSSSNVTVVPVGTQVPAKKSSTFVQTADGTKPATFNLTLKGNWPSDQNQRTRTATVKLDEACKHPTPPATPTTPQTLSTSTVAQVQAPKGAVNAGSAAKSVNMTAVAGLVASVTLVSTGVVVLIKRSR